MTAFLLAVFVALPAAAQDRGPLGPMDEGVPTYVCQRAVGKIQVDGKLGEASWRLAKPTTRFVFPWPDQPGDKQKTTVQLVWDDEALYVGYTCRDTDITGVYTRRDDPTYKDDCVEVFLDVAPDKTDFYYGFEMNCRGVMYDYFMCWPLCILNRFNCKGWRLATHIDGTLNDSSDTDRGWTLEVRTPFANFEGLRKDPPKDGERWRMQMNRWDGKDKRALSEWTPSGKSEPDPHRPAGFGVLEFSAEAAGE
jgi:hypothetical protein